MHRVHQGQPPTEPDGLSRREGAPIWVVPVAEAEDAVLDEWAELHDRVRGFPPNW